MDILLYALLTFAAFGVAILLLVIVRAPQIIWLATRLGCPNCHSRSVKQTGPHTLRCENCGSTFSIGK